MSELQRMIPAKLDGMELRITAIIGDRFRGDYVEGFSTARIYNSSIRLNFMGGSPQVIKPAMPFTCYVSVQSNTIQSNLVQSNLVQSNLI